MKVGDKASKRGHRGEEDLGLVEARVDDTDAVWKLIRYVSRARSPNANQLSSHSHW